MTENLNLGNENLMETEGENESVVSIDTANEMDEVNTEFECDKEIVADENADNESEDNSVEGEAEEKSDDSDGTDVETEETGDENPETDNIEDETEDEKTDGNDNSDVNEEKMSKKEKIALLIIGIILLLLLILLGIWGFNKTNRGLNIRDIDTSNVSSYSQIDDENGNDTDNYYLYGQDTSSDKQYSSDKNESVLSKPKNTSSNSSSNLKNDGSQNNDDKKPQNSITDNGNDDSNKKEDDSSNETNPEDSGSNGNDSDMDKDKNTDENNNTVPDYTGETSIRITKIKDDTGVITITVDNEKISVPVQTTVFNGRVTKSGVAQGKMFGFDCGATVMIYYPQSEGMGTTEFTGYMSRIDNSLTILVDINGEKSKMLIKINGFKSLK